MSVEVLIYRSLRVILKDFTRRAINAEDDMLYRTDPSGKAKGSTIARLRGPAMTYLLVQGASLDSKLLMIETDLTGLKRAGRCHSKRESKVRAVM